MSYCESCRERQSWPNGLPMSSGKCDVCRKTTDCYIFVSDPRPGEDAGGGAQALAEPMEQVVLDLSSYPKVAAKLQEVAVATETSPEGVMVRALVAYLEGGKGADQPLMRDLWCGGIVRALKASCPDLSAANQAESVDRLLADFESQLTLTKEPHE